MNAETLMVRRFAADYARNGSNLLLLVLVPVAFVMAAAPALAGAARLLGGVGNGSGIQTVTAGWAAGFLSGIAMYFQVSASRSADRRLVLAGMPRAGLGAARLLTGTGLAAVATLAALATLAARGDLETPLRTAVGTAMFALVYVGIGAVVGATVPGAVNGTVLILFVWILDVFFGPTLSRSPSSLVRLLPTHYVSLWTVDVPPGHTGPGELAMSLAWVVLALAAAAAVVMGRDVGRPVVGRPVAGGAQLRTGLRLGWHDWRRTPILWVMLAVVPAVFILLSEAVTPHGHTPVSLRENGSTSVVMVDPAEMHAGTMAPIAVASLAALVGVFMVLDSREADQRLLLAGERRAILLLTRMLVVLTAAGVATLASLAVTATVFEPHQWSVYAAGNALLAMTYACIGMLLGPLFGRVSSVFLAFLIPFLDLGIWQSPMLRAQPEPWAQWLPGYGGTRVVLDGALTDGFDEASSSWAALAWLLLVAVVAAAVVTPHGAGHRSSGGRTRIRARVRSAGRCRGHARGDGGTDNGPTGPGRSACRIPGGGKEWGDRVEEASHARPQD